MQFKEGASVLTADGQTVGTIERFVIDPHARAVSGLVVRQGFLFTEDKVIPVDLVATATEEKVTLRAEIGDPQDLPLFEETHYVAPTEGELDEGYAQDYYMPLYYYPPMGAVVPPVTYQPQVIHRNIPNGDIPVATGAAVISHDGKHVGNVARVITDTQTQAVTHVVISQGLLFREEKIVPMMWVDVVEEDEIHLVVSAELLDRVRAR
jgi:uncharacterized protein YrrD